MVEESTNCKHEPIYHLHERNFYMMENWERFLSFFTFLGLCVSLVGLPFFFSKHSSDINLFSWVFIESFSSLEEVFIFTEKRKTKENIKPYYFD